MPVLAGEVRVDRKFDQALHEFGEGEFEAAAEGDAIIPLADPVVGRIERQELIDLFVWNFALQSVQAYARMPSCTCRSCVVRFDFCLNAALQREQRYGRASLCVASCRLRLTNVAKRARHVLHTNASPCR